ncbi:unnamed protein product, partial [Amoebophrya sp. A25]
MVLWYASSSSPIAVVGGAAFGFLHEEGTKVETGGGQIRVSETRNNMFVTEDLVTALCRDLVDPVMNPILQESLINAFPRALVAAAGGLEEGADGSVDGERTTGSSYTDARVSSPESVDAGFTGTTQEHQDESSSSSALKERQRGPTGTEMARLVLPPTAEERMSNVLFSMFGTDEFCHGIKNAVRAELANHDDSDIGDVRHAMENVKKAVRVSAAAGGLSAATEEETPRASRSEMEDGTPVELRERVDVRVKRFLVDVVREESRHRGRWARLKARLSTTRKDSKDFGVDGGRDTSVGGSVRDGTINSVG